MDSAALLDLLGNENRRRILRLLSRKPCYVTEISEYLGVSPKAVIDHLRKLEEAGLVESTTDESRRKYFHISRNLRLEVNVSPYSFGTKSAYAASPNLDVSTCRYLSVDVSYDDDADALADLAAELQSLEELSQELSMVQRWVQGRITDTYDRLTDAVGGDAESRLYAQVVAAVAAGAHTTAEITRRTDAPEGVVRDVVDRLDDQGILDRETDGWSVAETA